MERFKIDMACFVCALYLSMSGSNLRGVYIDMSKILKGRNGSGVPHSCFGGGMTSGGCWAHLRPAAAGPSRTSETEFTKTCETERRTLCPSSRRLWTNQNWTEQWKRRPGLFTTGRTRAPLTWSGLTCPRSTSRWRTSNGSLTNRTLNSFLNH